MIADTTTTALGYSHPICATIFKVLDGKTEYDACCALSANVSEKPRNGWGDKKQFCNVLLGISIGVMRHVQEHQRRQRWLGTGIKCCIEIDLLKQRWTLCWNTMT